MRGRRPHADPRSNSPSPSRGALRRICGRGCTAHRSVQYSKFDTDLGLKAEDDSCPEGKATRRLGTRDSGRGGTGLGGTDISLSLTVTDFHLVSPSHRHAVFTTHAHVGGPRLRMRLEHHTSTTHSINPTRSPGHICTPRPRRCGRAGVRRKTNLGNGEQGLVLILHHWHGPVRLRLAGGAFTLFSLEPGPYVYAVEWG